MEMDTMKNKLRLLSVIADECEDEGPAFSEMREKAEAIRKTGDDMLRRALDGEEVNADAFDLFFSELIAQVREAQSFGFFPE